jgi:hypothetical protein
MFNPVLLECVFDLRRDGIVILKVLREGPAQCAHALLLLLYGYHQVKKEYVWRPNSIGPPNNPESPSVALQKNTQETTATWFKVAGGRQAIIR